MHKNQIALGRSWLKTFKPQYTPIQESIYFAWLTRIVSFAHQNEIEPDENFLWQKTCSYFFPHLFLLRSPFHLPDMDAAVEVINSLRGNSNLSLVIYGDRDADGITSSAILYHFFLQHFKITSTTLSALEEEKFGVNIDVAKRILTYKPDILITLDCGSQNKDSFIFLREKIPALKIIVIDHHNIPAQVQDYPQVEAFINPKRLERSNSEYDMCTAGIAYKFVRALTYSNTKNYQSLTLLHDADAQELQMKNGIGAEQEKNPTRFMYFSADAHEPADEKKEFFNAQKLWQQTLQKNRKLFLYNDFCRRAQRPISTVEKYNILENLCNDSLLQHTNPFLTFAAIGTIADLMPLMDDNRILVAEGISFLNSTSSQIPVSLRELFKCVGTDLKTANEKGIAFTVCPAINAAGRLGKSEIALAALTESDPLQAAKKSFALFTLNNERKNLTAQAQALIEENLTGEHKKFPIAVFYHPEIHRGISGLVAARIAELLQKPAIVLVNDGESLRGSLRAYHGENIYKLLQSVSSMLIQWGGHRQAAGFSLATHDLQKFTQSIYQNSLQLSQESGENNFSADSFFPPIPILDSEVKKNLWSELAPFAPYGQMNPHPQFLVRSTSEVQVTWMGANNSHARLNFTGNRHNIDAVWFSHSLHAQDTCLSEYNFIAEPHLNFFRSQENLQLQIKSVYKENFS